ncbi:hypothetical protein GSI_15363 [Ganoderma sinense ZZ0214-1]|uniref:Uncharacterized protein n=1 Tax=Ganoderma sinense ZZ0214-1 TaxID=1077348 RepID=A0A2G8RMD8_9APHY|nr:hypothetical protein GSI_15363 [Ganoderma sinense ZZ0214-1]
MSKRVRIHTFRAFQLLGCRARPIAYGLPLHSRCHGQALQLASTVLPGTIALQACRPLASRHPLKTRLRVGQLAAALEVTCARHARAQGERDRALALRHPRPLTYLLGLPHSTSVPCLPRCTAAARSSTVIVTRGRPFVSRLRHDTQRARLRRRWHHLACIIIMDGNADDSAGVTRCGVSSPPPGVFQNGTKCGVNSAFRGPPRGADVTGTVIANAAACSRCFAAATARIAAARWRLVHAAYDNATHPRRRAGFGLTQARVSRTPSEPCDALLTDSGGEGICVLFMGARLGGAGAIREHVVPPWLRGGFQLCCPAATDVARQAGFEWWSTDHSAAQIRCMAGLWGTISAIVPIARPLAANGTTWTMNNAVRGWMDIEHGVSSIERSLSGETVLVQFKT